VRGGFKVTLGTLPDYAFQGKGLRITGARPDSPASRAGLTAGDVIVKLDKHEITNIHDYMSDPEVRKLSWQARLAHPAWQAEPNAGHRALVALERAGKLHALVTQNIDGLHQRAGSALATVIEVHGTMREVMCMACAWRGPMPLVLDRVRAGEDDPPCERCGGILKSATISFGQSLVPSVIARAMRAAEQTDLLIAVGTSLQVYPVAGAVPLASAAGARVVIVNAEPTPFDEMADAVLRQPIGEILPALCSAEKNCRESTKTRKE